MGGPTVVYFLDPSVPIQNVLRLPSYCLVDTRSLTSLPHVRFSPLMVYDSTVLYCLSSLCFSHLNLLRMPHAIVLGVELLTVHSTESFDP